MLLGRFVLLLLVGMEVVGRGCGLERKEDLGGAGSLGYCKLLLFDLGGPRLTARTQMAEGRLTVARIKCWRIVARIECWRSFNLHLQACEGRKVAHIFCSGPSGLVPGDGKEGRLCCPLFPGDVKGP
jgi:hypothetical protein